MAPETPRKPRRIRLPARFTAVSWHDLAAAMGPPLLISAVAIWIAFKRYMPFWMANLVDRTVVLLVPILVLLIPGLKIVPSIYRWRITSRIYRWYGALLALEREVFAHPEAERRAELLERLEAVEHGVNALKVPLSFADPYYVLRQHIGFVGDRLR